MPPRNHPFAQDITRHHKTCALAPGRPLAAPEGHLPEFWNEELRLRGEVPGTTTGGGNHWLAGRPGL